MGIDAGRDTEKGCVIVAGEMSLVEKSGRLPYPWCEKCGRYVDKFSIDTPVDRFTYHGMTYQEHTGEIICTVEGCGQKVMYN
jgi:hypothetical protein